MTSRAYNDYMKELELYTSGNERGRGVREASENMLNEVNKPSVNANPNSNNKHRSNTKEPRGSASPDKYGGVDEYYTERRITGDSTDMNLIARMEHSKNSMMHSNSKPQARKPGHPPRIPGSATSRKSPNKSSHKQPIDEEDGYEEENQPNAFEMNESDDRPGEAHPYAPKISMKSREIWEANPKEPLHLRYKEEIERRKNKLHELERKASKERELKDKEAADSARKWTKKRNDSKEWNPDRNPFLEPTRKDIYESGMKWMKDKNSRIISEQSSRINQELDGFRFQPQINKDTAYYSNISKSFEKRQVQYEKEKQQRIQQLDSQIYGSKEHMPHMNEKSVKIVNKNRVRQEILEKAKIIRAKHGLDTREFEDSDDMLFRQLRSKERITKPIDYIGDDDPLPLKKSGTAQKAIKNLKTYNSNTLTTKISPKMIAVIPETGNNYRTKSKPRELQQMNSHRGASKSKSKERVMRSARNPTRVYESTGRGLRDEIDAFDVDDF